MKKSSLFISKNFYLKDKIEFNQNFDFIHQNFDTYHEITNSKVENKEKEYVKVKHIKGKR